MSIKKFSISIIAVFVVFISNFAIASTSTFESFYYHVIPNKSILNHGDSVKFRCGFFPDYVGTGAGYVNLSTRPSIQFNAKIKPVFTSVHCDAIIQSKDGSRYGPYRSNNLNFGYENFRGNIIHYTLTVGKAGVILEEKIVS